MFTEQVAKGRLAVVLELPRRHTVRVAVAEQLTIREPQAELQVGRAAAEPESIAEPPAKTVWRILAAAAAAGVKAAWSAATAARAL